MSANEKEFLDQINAPETIALGKEFDEWIARGLIRFCMVIQANHTKAEAKKRCAVIERAIDYLLRDFDLLPSGYNDDPVGRTLGHRMAWVAIQFYLGNEAPITKGKRNEHGPE